MQSGDNPRLISKKEAITVKIKTNIVEMDKKPQKDNKTTISEPDAHR